MSIFRMTVEQKADQALSMRFYVTYIISVMVMAAGYALITWNGGDSNLLHRKEATVLLYAAITTLGGAAKVTRLPWRWLIVYAALMGAIGFAVSWGFGSTF